MSRHDQQDFHPGDLDGTALLACDFDLPPDTVAMTDRQKLEAVTAVHARYFDLDGAPGFDDTTPEPEDVWRYDRDFRAALRGDCE